MVGDGKPNTVTLETALLVQPGALIVVKLYPPLMVNVAGAMVGLAMPKAK
jgi:hypothetical protein